MIMSSAQVNVLTLLSQTHFEKGRYAVSVDVTPKKKFEAVQKKRDSDKQVYKELDCVAGSCSPEIELPLKNKKCEVQFTVSGALKPQSELEPGEDIIEYNESLSECRRLLTLVPTYDVTADGTGTIKYKVDGRVKHTVTIHDVPTTRSVSFSTASSSSSYADVRGAERQSSVLSHASSQSLGSMECFSPNSSNLENTVDEGSARELNASASGEGRWQEEQPEAEATPQRSQDQRFESTREHFASASGEGHWQEEQPEAVPIPPRSLEQRFGNMAIRNRGPDVVPPVDQYPGIETAYDKLLCNESLSTLSWALSPDDATRLIIGLSVPNNVREICRKNHQGDVVSGNYECFLYWRSQKRSSRQEHESSNQYLFEDLILELDDIGRKDLKVVLKRALEENKKLEKKDFKHL